MRDRGHASSCRRLVRDIVEWLQSLRAEDPSVTSVLAGISWGAKLALITAARHPELVDGIALICPGLLPRVGVSRKEKMQIAWAVLANRRKLFPIPLSDPALFTANPEAQAFIASDPHSLRQGTAGLMAASFIIDRLVQRVPGRVQQPALLMLAGRDRIVDNETTAQLLPEIGLGRSPGDRIPRGASHAGVRPRPHALWARPDRLDGGPCRRKPHTRHRGFRRTVKSRTLRASLINQDFGSAVSSVLSGFLVARGPDDRAFLVDFADCVRLDLRVVVAEVLPASSVSAIEFMQKRRPVGGGPSWKT